MPRVELGLCRTLGMVGLTAVLTFVAAGCGDDEEDGGAASSNGGAKTAKVVVSSPADSGDVVPIGGLTRFGEEFGITQTDADVERFDAHATAAQLLLSGKADVLAGSFGANLTLIEAGQDLKIFCPAQSSTAEMIVGIGDVDSIDQLKDENVTLAVDSPGGGADFQLNALLVVSDAGFLVADVPSKVILEDGGQRVSALQNGEAQISIVDPSELLILQEALGEDKVNVISTLAEDVGDEVVDMTFAARPEWLEENAELAANFCATVITAADRLTQDFDTYQELANEYIEPDPDPAGLQALFDLGQKFTVWPDDPMITQEQFDANVAIAAAAGSIEKPDDLVYEDVIATDVMERTNEILEGAR